MNSPESRQWRPALVGSKKTSSVFKENRGEEVVSKMLLINKVCARGRLEHLYRCEKVVERSACRILISRHGGATVIAECTPRLRTASILGARTLHGTTTSPRSTPVRACSLGDRIGSQHSDQYKLSVNFFS
jgi:hypothetical protein